MSNTIKKLQHLIDASQTTINNPIIPISESLGIKKNKRGKWIYSHGTWIGSAVIVGTASIGKIGITMGAIAAGATASASIPVVGLVIIAGGTGYYLWKRNKEKREQTEKERLYQEIIRKQQAAINRQKELIRELEEKLRKANKNNQKNQEEIQKLRECINNLSDLIDVLTQQVNQFKRH